MRADSIFDDRPMTAPQIVVVVVCIVLYAVDGFDVLAISFAAPGIAAEWNVSRAELGIVLAMELFGMSAGSILLGRSADGRGRRPIILGCLTVTFLGMCLASIVGTVGTLLAVRFLTGIGIGGMLATINAMVAEYSNVRHRSFCVAAMAAGYPVGVIVGGAIASTLLAHFDWRAVFVLGAALTGGLIPVVWLLVPESIAFLAHKKAPGNLQKINVVLRRMGHSAIEKLPDTNDEARASSWRSLLSRRFARTSVLLTAAYLAHIMTFYFILKWIPKIVVDMGYSASLAGGVLVWANVGGATGSMLLGWLTHHLRVRILVIAALIGAVVMIIVFGQGQADLAQLALVVGIAGAFTNSAVVGLYALIAQSYPTHLRASGTGFVIGVGRAGAALGPVIAGLLFEGGFGLPFVSFVMALGSLIAVFMVLLHREPSVA